MNKKTLLFSVMTAILAVVLVNFASALTSGITSTVSDVVLGSGVTIAGINGESIPVRVTFVADENATDVKVKAWIEGTKDDITASTSRFNLIDGSTYTKLLYLSLPSELKDLSKEYTLHVGVVSADESFYEEYTVRLQRESYGFEILSIDYSLNAEAGNTIPVSVVVRNNGMEKINDGFVLVSIPELGVSAKDYFGDLLSVDPDDDDDTPDAIKKTVYLTLPKSAKEGVYNLEVKVYNKDATLTANKIISVDASSATTVISAVNSQDIKAGETKTYDLIIVNSDNKVGIYTIQTVSGTALSVSAPSVVTVGPNSSERVPITVTASSSADEGAYTFSVSVGDKNYVFGANVVKGRASNSVVALTVILAIIFVVLLIVLIVLLTRKEDNKQIEEVETSYY